MHKKTLFITGGHGEIGSAIRIAFADYTIISPRSTEMDCSSIDSIKTFIAQCDITHIDVFIHAAGMNIPKSYTDVRAESLERSMQINAFSFLYVIQALSAYFIDNTTKIVAISSIYGSISRVGRLEYNASKEALNGMVKTLALELAPKGIVVNAISPGFIETALTYKNNTKDTIAEIVAHIPLGRMGQPNEIAKFAHFFTSEQNTFMTGQHVIMDGGYLIGGFQK